MVFCTYTLALKINVYLLGVVFSFVLAPISYPGKYIFQFHLLLFSFSLSTFLNFLAWY